jgi:hypothetical protein
MANTTVATKVENNGATAQGRLSAAEINDMVGAINSKTITAFVADTTALAGVSGAADIKSVWVENLGLFQFSVTGPANGQNIFAATGGGFWVRKRTAPMINTLLNVATINVDAAQGEIHRVTITGNRHFNKPTNLVAGQRFTLQITQGTGSVEGSGFSVTYDAAYRFSKSITEPILSQGEGNLDIIEFIYNAVSDTLDVVSTSIGLITPLP